MMKLFVLEFRTRVCLGPRVLKSHVKITRVACAFWDFCVASCAKTRLFACGYGEISLRRVFFLKVSDITTRDQEKSRYFDLQIK